MYEVALQALLNDPLRSVHVQGSQDIVQDQNLSPGINGPSERHPRLLSSTQRQTLLSNLGLVSRLKHCQVFAESALMDDLAVPGLIELGTEEDVIADGLVLDPRFLSGVRHTVLPGKVKPRVRSRRDVMQLPEQGHQKGGLSATGGSNDQVDLSLFEGHFSLDPQVEVSASGARSGGPRGLGRPREGGVADTDARGVVVLHTRSNGALFLCWAKGVEELGLRRKG